MDRPAKGSSQWRGGRLSKLAISSGLAACWAGPLETSRLVDRQTNHASVSKGRSPTRQGHETVCPSQPSVRLADLMEHLFEKPRYVAATEDQLTVQETVRSLTRRLADERTSVAGR